MPTIESDIVIIGSGIGASLAAVALAKKGRKVVIVEQGPLLSTQINQQIFESETFFQTEAVPKIPVNLQSGRIHSTRYLPAAVGGLAHFYAAISLRMREQEFERWPFSYAEIEPFYSEAEQLMMVSGIAGNDPCDPPRSQNYRETLPRMSVMSQKLKSGAEALGLKPFAHPLAISFENKCRRCRFCNQIPCPYHAKFTPANLLAKYPAIEIYDEATVQKINWTGKKVDDVRATKKDGSEIIFKAKQFIVAAGAIQTPKLLLQSGFGEMNPLIGTHFMTHCLGLIVGFFKNEISASPELEKWWSVTDHYFADDGSVRGIIQQDQLTTLKRFFSQLPPGIRQIVKKFYLNTCQLLVIAEDEPQKENRILVDAQGGVKAIQKFSKKDEEKRAMLAIQAKKILKQSGAIVAVMKKGQSVYHACGTARMGAQPTSSVTNPYGQVWGMENLFVSDASLMPTSSGVNPSLTIGAMALRVAHYMN